MKTWADYQKKAIKTATYKEKILYPALGLADESIEFFNSIGHKSQLREFGNCFWHFSALVHDIKSDINSIAEEANEFEVRFANLKDATFNMVAASSKICGVVKEWLMDEIPKEPSYDKVIEIEFELVSYMDSINYICRELKVPWQEVAQMNLDKKE